MTNTLYFHGIVRDDASTTSSSSDISLQQLPSTGQPSSSSLLYKVIGKAINALITRRSGSGSALNKYIESVGGASPAFTGITMEESGESSPATPAFAQISKDKSVEFSYEELAEATSNFNLANKIPQAGFGAAYYAELRGEKAAIKTMDMQASKEFLAELKVLTHVHHLNLVAGFGLTMPFAVRITPSRIVGTYGYMAPEYAHYGDVSPKVDVYAFGVVLYELISAREAIVKTSESMSEWRGLVYLFEDVLNLPEPKDKMHALVDPRLKDNYPIDSVYKVAQLARACTHENPQVRPSMRSIVVALRTLL